MRGAWGVHVSEDGVGGSSRPLLDVVVWGLPSGNEAVVAVPNLGTLLGPRGQAGEVDTFITVLADYQILLKYNQHRLMPAHLYNTAHTTIQLFQHF